MTKENPIMRRTPFQTVTLEDLSAGHDAYWQGALAALSIKELDAQAPEPEAIAEPVSFVMPYQAAMHRYTQHVARCAVCSDGSWLDQCPEGDRLGTQAANACVEQGKKAASN